jgi:glycosyltransferase 2 family protein
MGAGLLRSPRLRRLASRRVLGTLAGLLVLGFLLAALVDGWRSASSFDWSVDPLWLAAGLAALVVLYVGSALLYAAIVGRLHRPPPDRRATVSAWARSLLGRYVPGTVVMVLGRAAMGQRSGVPGRVTVAATAYEQALTLAAAGVGSIGFILAYGDLGRREWAWAVVAVVPLALAVLHPRCFRPLSGWLLARARREPLSTFLSGRQVAAFFGCSLVVVAMLALAAWALVRAAAGAAAGGLAFVGLAYVLSFLVSTLAFVFPSGLGVREGAFALALTHTLPTSVAVACAVGVRLVVTLFELGFVAVATLAGRRR